MLEEKLEIKIGVHGDIFHADDVLCISMLKHLFKNQIVTVVRTRDEAILETCDICADVGGIYDHSKRRYDHHQSSFNERNESLKERARKSVKEYLPDYGPKLCGAGLIYRHYGEDIIISILNTYNREFDDNDIEFIYKIVKEELIIPIDASDNGESNMFFMHGVIESFSLRNIVYNLNPIDDTQTQDEQFDKAVNILSEIFKNNVLYTYSISRSRKLIDEVLQNTNDGILIFENYVPYDSYVKEQPNKFKDIKFVIFKNSNKNSYFIKTMYYNRAIDTHLKAYHENGDKRKYRIPLPVELSGKNEKELEKLSSENENYKGILFVHNGLHLAGVDTLENCLKFVKYLINEQEDCYAIQ